MPLFSKQELEQAAAFVHQHMPATPQYQWPQLSQLTGTELWVKHENHTPTGAFKVRGGITFMDWLKRTHPEVVASPPPGNHGQSQARATRPVCRPKSWCHTVIPRKKCRHACFGADLIELARILMRRVKKRCAGRCRRLVSGPAIPS
ncbi:MAG: pyridoxal-phosphate dependent enzyme [Thiolinea sp.]